MAWKTDKLPLEYLQQRVRYYEKGIKKLEKMKEKGFSVGDRIYTDEDFDNAIKNQQFILNEFKKASYLIAENME